MSADVAAVPLPGLRNDLHIHPGARDYRGAPTWVLQDPVKGQFYQIDETGFYLLSCWRQGTPEKVLRAVQQRFGVELDEEKFRDFLSFLIGAELVVADAGYLRDRLSQARALKDQSLLSWITHRYLFFRIPLVRPDRFLDRLYPLVRPLLSPFFLRLTLIVGLIGLLMAARRWHELVAAVPWFFTLEGMAVFFVVLTLVKVLHELGHGLACKHYGLQVPTMGVAFMVMWPVLYTDATDSWRLRGRLQRALIDSAGVITELMLACYALFLWSLLPDGMLRSVALTVATTTIVLSLLVNLNPFMRFDGYYFLSDISNIPNIQNRSFALARWQIRCWLFGSTRDLPERFPPHIHRWLVLYAFGTWIYRFLLFLGIALLVYHFFFKALGVVLFIVEIWWFILRPVFAEVKQWPSFLKTMGQVRRRRMFWFGLGIILLGAIPWRSEMLVPAQLDTASVHRIYPAIDGLVTRIHVQEGDRVAAGDLLIEMASAQIEHELYVARLDVERVESILARSLGHDELVARRLVLEQQLAQARSTLDALQRKRQRLEIRSPVAGQVRDLYADLHEGRWITHQLHLLSVNDTARPRLLAWVGDDDVERLRAGATGYFHSQSGQPFGAVPVRVVRVESSVVSEIDQPMHASMFGGSIPVRVSEGDRLVPEVALYRVWLEAEQPVPEAMLSQTKGWARLKGERRSLFGVAWRWLVGGLIREAGF
jgi:putative peptide zinc metalloprotease protein